MCGVYDCPLRFREIINLRKLINDLTIESGIDLLDSLFGPGYILFDACLAIGLEPREVLPADTVNRIEARARERLWPLLNEAEDAEVVELDNIRVSEHSDWFGSLSEAEKVVMFQRD